MTVLHQNAQAPNEVAAVATALTQLMKAEDMILKAAGYYDVFSVKGANERTDGGGRAEEFRRGLIEAFEGDGRGSRGVGVEGRCPGGSDKVAAPWGTDGQDNGQRLGSSNDSPVLQRPRRVATSCSSPTPGAGPRERRARTSVGVIEGFSRPAKLAGESMALTADGPKTGANRTFQAALENDAISH